MKLNAKLVFPIVLLASISQADAQLKNDAALGVIFGDPTGISWRIRTGERKSLSGALGFAPDEHFRFHADYLWYAWPFTNPDIGLYYGVGGAVGFERHLLHGHPPLGTEHSSAFGVRIPLGLTYFIPRSPVELLVEVAPLLVIAPSSGAGLDGGIGARIHF
jgi:hypothetical protein